MGLAQVLLRSAFYLFYHQLAWTYDFVAAVVSLGRWQGWVRSSLPYLSGRVLEIGYGPGHLQYYLYENNLLSFGLDESQQMARVASRQLHKNRATVRLARGNAQYIPFEKKSFDSVVATFPNEYIFDPRTLREVRRVLASSGKLVILPIAWITGDSLFERLAAWLFRITGESPNRPRGISESFRLQFAKVGFETHSEIIKLKRSQVFIIIAQLSQII